MTLDSTSCYHGKDSKGSRAVTHKQQSLNFHFLLAAEQRVVRKGVSLKPKVQTLGTCGGTGPRILPTLFEIEA